MAEAFSSHTLALSTPAGSRASQDLATVRDRLIATMIDVVAEGGDPRLGETRALA
ncbi:MAG TPA: hypothetical protein VMB51_09145 [Solirubrobacteraceae bacterium]|nr:hypothetical protein [Solirubrobacteraceae bacterium]